MASYTKTTEFKRLRRHQRMGTERKAALRIHGTTPRFEVRSADAVANAPLEQLTPAERESREG